MSKLVILAVLSYLDSSGDQLFCDAVVICDGGAQSCHVHPIEACPGSYDPKADELKGKWNMGQCLTAQLELGAGGKRDPRTPVLGCSPDRIALDVDAAAVRAARVRK